MRKGKGLTRNKILECLKLRGAMSTYELSDLFGVTTAAIRQHTTALEANGLITITMERRDLGRPAHIYSITSLGDETFPRKYADLLVQLLDEARILYGEDCASSLFSARRRHLYDSLSIKLQGKNLKKQVQELSRIRAGDGFMSSFSEENKEYLLVERNCAYCQIARQYPEICTEQLALYRDLFRIEADVVRDKSIMNGDSCCVYRICPHSLEKVSDSASTRDLGELYEPSHL
jgi:predicted ArsR family transcriptional regulator